MLNTEIYLINLLIANAAVTAIVDPDNITVGPSDRTVELQSELSVPSINIFAASESTRTVPLAARDTQYQLDIWSRISQLQLEQIYEAVFTAMNFISYDQGNSHTFWQRQSGTTTFFETDMRLWHMSVTFTVWAIQP